MAATESLVVCSAGGLTCGLPVGSVAEIMRPLELDPVRSPHLAAVMGVARVRGEPTPVLDLATLVGGQSKPATRWVVLRVGAKRAVLAVEAVEGVRAIATGDVGTLPALASGAGQAAITQLGVLDAAVFAVLDAARIITLAEPR